MPILHLVPSSPAQLMILAVILAGFGAFVVTLLWVSVSVSFAQQAQAPSELAVAPASPADPATAPTA